MEHDSSQSRELLRESVKELREHIECCKELNQRLESKVEGLRKVLLKKEGSKVTEEDDKAGIIELQKISEHPSGTQENSK
ncbi:hypothetical protein Gasu2_22460 [Galdieria sulphuraria]|uniref:Uncharacterized protein n=1 Tax=Galdieria sulphuraria TaxID=130081 RepID=M2W9Y3_GALSU|nr:uncharacterized protein Gasu_00870 [Galdieria sulphuraria]EME32721.1 hypothetical protein Gasu_00870 [Galdieria sulphuraria]GJD07922.1 hypothetical protein Gasu2_22460 [Galdieria sulphuraria]|eukprot:XP_005709241.1 hypothetical protein Gasu_00870 [Galdieria sulphuraria]